MSNIEKFKFSKVLGTPLNLVENSLDGLVSFLGCSNSFISLNGIGIDMQGCGDETIINSCLTDKKRTNKKNELVSDIRIINKKKTATRHKGNSLGLTWLEALCAYLITEKTNLLPKLNELVDKLKYDTSVNVEEYIKYNRDILKVKENLVDLLDSVPVANDVSLEDFKIIENSRDEFMKKLDILNLDNMISTFLNYGYDISELKEEILKLLEVDKESIKNLNSFELSENEDKVKVYTQFYKSLIENDKITSRLNENFYNVFIAVTLGYMREVLGENHPLILTESSYETALWLNYNILEAKKYYKDIRDFLDLVISLLDKNEEISESDSLSPTTEIEKQNDLETILNEDKGKFKLTLFKTLAKEHKLVPDMSKTEQDPSNNYYIITFNNGLLHSIKPSVYYNPENDNHSIDVYIDGTENNKCIYSWNKELNYNDLISYLCKLVKDEEKKQYEKFKLTEFKQTCKNRIGLNINMSETPTIKNKYYNISTIPNEKQYIIKFIVPIIYKSTKGESKKLLIKTKKEEIYYTWEGSLDYADLYSKIVEIHQGGLRVLLEEYKEMKKQREKLEKERNDLIETHKKVLDEYENDKLKRNNKLISESENITSGKDTRSVLTSYILENHKEINLTPDFEVISTVLSRKLIDLGYPLEISLGPVSSIKGRGKSKVWALTNKDSILVVSEKAEEKKKIEGLLEGFVTRFTAGGTDSKTRRIRDGLTFMLCKSLGLDVRTYCEGSEFDSLYRTDKKTKIDFVKDTIKFYNDISQLFR